MPRANSRTVIGLDIGQQSIKWIRASANGGLLRIQDVDRIPLPLSGADLQATLRKAWEEMQPGQTPVVVQVGGGRLLYQYLEMEPEDPREPEQVARMEARRFGEMTDSSMEVSVSPVTNEPDERRLLLSMARPEPLELSIAPLRQLGANLVNICPAPVALYNGVAALGEPLHQAVIIADLGATHTEVVIGTGQGIRFARSFAMGTLQLTQAIASRQHISLQQAERMRIQAASLGDLPESFAETGEQFVRQWCQEIHACVQMFREGGGRGLDSTSEPRLLLCGGGSAWTPLAEAIKQDCGFAMGRVGRLPGFEQRESHEFMIAAGLAADGLGIARSPSSLITQDLRAQHNRRRNKRYWMVTAAFATASVGMLALTTQLSFQRENKAFQAKNATLKRRDQIRKDSEELRAKKRFIQQMLDPLEEVVANSTRIRDLTLFIAKNKDEGDFLTFLGDSQSYLRLRLDEAPEEEQEKGRQIRSPQEELQKREAARQVADIMRNESMNRLIIEGFTSRNDLSTVKSLIETLRTHPAVQRADLLSDDLVFPDTAGEKKWTRGQRQRFVLELILYQKSTVEEDGGRS